MTPFVRALALLVALTVSFAASAQKFEPQVGQEGKDVIWVPTPDEVVDRMLTMAQLGPNDFHMDLGSGDGKIVIAAAKRGAKALGIEYNPDMVKLAQDNAQKQGVAEKASFRRADIFQTDFTQATVITLYLLPALNMKLRPQLLAMRPGTRIVSHSFTMEDWEADETSTLDGRRAYFWMVPASVMGSWTLEQNNQRLDHGELDRLEIGFLVRAVAERLAARAAAGTPPVIPRGQLDGIGSSLGDVRFGHDAPR